MGLIIKWCNENNGFITAILSIIGLLLSVIAIVVSIRTARLPYKKKLKLTSSFDVAFSKNTITGEVTSNLVGISVNAANIGSRNVSITYLGICVKDKNSNWNKQKMTKIRDEITGTGMIAPAEIKTELYKKDDLLYSLSLLSGDAKIYLYAMDTEETEYFKSAGNAKNMLMNLEK
ncbi:hypothetical protein [uncultured Ruminococcus sp.]|uniref:hypothetical protein n=1 Tax=uncultured Ruminococcus sp. TaxID=165186 RepID=UPI0025D8A19E|nr:hypothetical protein [uncultured Ruminococcus sp.]